jgi:ribonuclease HI
MKLTLYTDGASRGNPGQAGLGIVIYAEDGQKIAEVSEYLGSTTNNVAEYQALIRGLEEAQSLGAKELEVFTDSELMARQINGQYKVKNAGLIPLYQKAKGLLSQFALAKVTHIRREYNKEADKLANMAVDQHK